MFKGTVTFRAAFPGIEFDTFEITPQQPDVLKASIKSSPSEGVTLKVDVAAADSIDSAIGTAREVATFIAQVLTYKFGTYYHEFGLLEHAFVEEVARPDGSTQPVHHLGTSLRLDCKADVWVAPGPQQMNEAKDLLEQLHHPGFIYYELFRSALGLNDPLSKFMALYNIVLSICNDLQEDVDAFVLSVQPGVDRNPPFRPRKSGTQETVYTRLRNQVGHRRSGTTIEETKGQMEVNLRGLVEVAKNLIDRQP